ncbi:hypothetical protein ACJMK2_044079 [Sinanodonta woodiana]|uniref:Uncharacterized protein n=1 Tax=Sinanodonta woodiana TaxID=1069815 RepID=A0ABD3W067_SINWO
MYYISLDVSSNTGLDDSMSFSENDRDEDVVSFQDRYGRHDTRNIKPDDLIMRVLGATFYNITVLTDGGKISDSNVRILVIRNEIVKCTIKTGDTMIRELNLNGNIIVLRKPESDHEELCRQLRCHD